MFNGIYSTDFLFDPPTHKPTNVVKCVYTSICVNAQTWRVVTETVTLCIFQSVNCNSSNVYLLLFPHSKLASINSVATVKSLGYVSDYTVAISSTDPANPLHLCA